jgi:glutathione peroxidase
MGLLWIMPAMKAILAVATLTFALAMTTSAAAPDISSIPLKDINGKATSLKDYQGKVLLIVNVASKCGLTPQYKALESTYRKYQAQGFTILAFPCNDFGAQEPGSNSEIKQFCSTKYDVTFPLFDKLHVKGAEQHPLYAALTGKDAAYPGEIQWNFGKFLIGRDGKVLQRWHPKITPDAEEVTKAIEAALAAK